MRKMRTTVKMMALTAVIVLVASACATRGFVRTEDAVLDAKVDTLAGTVEETQERTVQNAERIGQVDQRAQAANMAAQTSQAAADAAAMAAEDVDGRVDQVEAAASRLILEVTINEAQGGFGSTQSDLPDAARVRLDQLILQLAGSGQASFIEIEGHTDNTGDETYNMRLGLRRAEAVKTYLYEQHNVPLHKMNTISYGESRPAMPNDSRENRAQNRRVVVRVRS
jgi:outer membrane protein OmpA-like peptidoglycan-associated protein